MPNHTQPGSTASLNQKLGEEKTENEASTVECSSCEELQKQLTESEEKVAQYLSRIQRIQADAENTKRRVERDVANAHKFALERFVLELLPIIDSLERAIAAHNQEDNSSGSLLDGIHLTLKMFQTTLEKFNVQAVDPKDQPFNPELHQAVSTQSDTAVKPNIVLNVLQKGYLLNQRLIRPALVVVSKP